MSKPTYRLSVKYKGRSWNKTLRGSDWDKNYADIAKFVTRRSGKAIDTECYVTVGNKTVSSNDVFESLITTSNQSDSIELIVHDGPPPDEESDDNHDSSEAKCVIICQTKAVKFYLETDDGAINDGKEAFQEFCDFLGDEVGLPDIDIEQMDDSIEIYSIKNKDDIDNDSTQIESYEDFGDIFEDFDPNSDPRQVFYFLIKTCQFKEENEVTLTIDLGGTDCKTNDVNIKINKEVDSASWTNILKSVGHACGDPEWQSKYFLSSTNNDKGAVIETSQKLSQFLTESGDKARLFVQAKDFRAWLTEWELGQYISKFNDEGYDDPMHWGEFCEDTDGTGLETEGLIIKKGHRKKFVRKWKSVFEAEGTSGSRNTSDNRNSNSNSSRSTVKKSAKIQQPGAAAYHDKDDEKKSMESYEKVGRGKKNGNIQKRMIFPDGINVIPFEKREYILPKVKDEDYAFKGGKGVGFVANAVSVLTTVRNKFWSLGGHATKGDIVDSMDTGAYIQQAKRAPQKLFGSKKHKIILVCGKTGAGKSTLINSMVNYIFNVQYDDKFRLRLIQEKKKAKGDAVSCTDHISSYTIKKPKGGNINYDLTIVDTPGFGDSRGVRKDMQILEEFKYVFNSILTEIDGICFVVKSADNRLDASQTYVFNNILNLWAKNVSENIFILMTFADGKRSNCIDALNANDVLKNVKKRFKINNSAFTDDPLDKDFDDLDTFDKLFWDMGTKCFEMFFNSLDKVTPKSIEKSKKVLRQRDEIQTKIHHISMSLNNTLLKQQEVHKQKQFIKKHEGDINAGKEVVYDEKQMRYEQFPVDNHLVTTCTAHQRSCHPECCVEDKNSCCIMNSDRYCEVCSCPASEHINASYVYKQVVFIKKISNWDTNANLKKTYKQATLDKQRASNKIQQLECDLFRLEQDAKDQLAMVQNLRNELEKIALRPKLSTVGDYIDQLIDNENQSPERDADKIKLLQELKKREEIIRKLQEKNLNNISDISDMI